jgi:uncharacterized protein DUF1302
MRGRLATGAARRRAALLGLASLAIALPCGARDIDLGAPDLKLRFDNTLRYNVGIRTDPVNAKLAASPLFTAGESGVPQGGLTTSRLDLLAELDLAYVDRAGARVSAAGWYDYAYHSGDATRSDALASRPGSYVGDQLSSYVLDRYRGPWGEILDAFAYARFDAGAVPIVVKAGRHAVSWGESLMLPGFTHGIAYSQVPLDLAKGQATPGVEAKELFRPLASVSAQAQLAPTVSLAAQVFLEWQSYLYPEGGTFYGAADFGFNGPDGIQPPGSSVYVVNGGVSWPRDAGEWGTALRWSPAWLDGTIGLYYRRYSDKFAAVLVSPNPGGAGPIPGVPSPSRYRQYYGEDVDLAGLSFAKQILGVSVGAEASYRHNTPLLAQSAGWVVPKPGQPVSVLFPHGPPALLGNTYQARGDTMHALVNAVGVVSGVPGFSSLSWAVEGTYSRWVTVSTNEDMFFGEGFGVCRGDPALGSEAKSWRDGCATRDHYGVGAGLTPTWYRVFSGTDLLLPVAVVWTVRGNSPVMMGGNQASGTYSAGVAADVRNRWRFDLRYVDFFGLTSDNGTMVTSANGLQALLKNRGSVTLTAKATF